VNAHREEVYVEFKENLMIRGVVVVLMEVKRVFLLV
jgi:hypothetical protein